MQEPLDLTALILTHNEELHIERCIHSLKGLVRDIVIVDSGSTDGTRELAQALGARVFTNPWVNYATQFQWGLDHGEISTRWVMRIDADEYLESGSRAALAKLIDLPAEVNGVYIRRRYHFLGQWIRHGSMYPIWHLRLWHHSQGRIENRWMDEHIVLNDPVTERLEVDIVDDNLNSVSWWIGKHNSYATREMLDLLNQRYHFLPQDDALKHNKTDTQARIKRIVKERIYQRLPLFVRPFLYFLFRYFIRLGFLDGRKGFAFHFMQGFWYRALVDLKVLEAEIWIAESSERDAEALRNLLAGKTGLKL